MVADTERKTLLTYSELAEWRKDNPAILTGYRAELGSWIGCFQSVASWHNETVNMWSHLLGAGAVVCAVACFHFFRLSEADLTSVFMTSRSIWDSAILIYPFPSEVQPSVTWVDSALLMLFFLGALICFLCSSTFHASLCHSMKVVRIMNRIDYLGILVLGTVNFFSTFHYSFFCDPALRDLYITLMTMSGSTGIYLVCAPTYASAAYRRMRTYTFFTLGFVAVFPFVHSIWRYGWTQASRSFSSGWIAVEVVTYIGGALMYAERCPEFLFPGRFDLVGSSHQIFHVCSLIAVFAHYAAVREGFLYWHWERQGQCI